MRGEALRTAGADPRFLDPQRIWSGADNEDMRSAMKRWDMERVDTRAALAAEEAAAVVTLHPEAAELYRAELADIQEALRDEETRAEATALLRKPIAEITLTPVDGVRGEMRVDLRGRSAGLMLPADEVPLAESFSFAVGGEW